MLLAAALVIVCHARVHLNLRPKSDFSLRQGGVTGLRDAVINDEIEAEREVFEQQSAASDCWRSFHPKCLPYPQFDRRACENPGGFVAPPPIEGVIDSEYDNDQDEISVGCDPTEPHGAYCGFWSGEFVRAMFPKAKITIVPLRKDRAEQETPIDLFFGYQHFQCSYYTHALTLCR
jgi:hypothetical protein